MLFTHRYLNEQLLDECVAALEDGLRESDTEHTTGAHGGNASIDLKLISGGGSVQSQTESTVIKSDHAAARFKRLLDAGHTNPEDIGWVQVCQPDVDFKDIGIGAFIEWECDIYIPPALEKLANSSDLKPTIEMVSQIMPFAKTLNLDTPGMPEPNQLDAMMSLLDKINIKPVIIGEDSDTPWRIVGSLDSRWLRDGSSLDDRVITTAKVKKIIPEKRWYPLTSLPGLSLVNRAERRRLEKTGPTKEEDKDKFLEGPLIIVDYLALSS